MESYLFVDTKATVFRVRQQNRQVRQTEGGNPNFVKFALLVLLLCCVGMAFLTIKKAQHKTNQQTQNSQKLETLVQKAVNNEQLTELEWSELCELLSSEKGIHINDCENCRDYIRAKLGGKHDVFLQNYSKDSNQELQKA